MTIKVKRTGLPPELEESVMAHAAAMVAGDEGRAAKFVDDVAKVKSSLITEMVESGAIRESAKLSGKFTSYEVIARARLGFQYLVKLRLHGDDADLNLQNRWHQTNGGDWRIAEIEDIGSQSPWKKPERNPSFGLEEKIE
jgi:hypothetical protein